ncbi:protein FAR1-RELATED SEQUENCE 6-like [Humulus lupulus]|uniref:protein FAR1-RELATED SEQUENCE 6-like n=1 Tax=Humulus lupulus TaxID=3486 RepID=UPI002B40BD82|nr:protein FAR1-RELATED SEQUENCE 6-like [Humulus lupulus]
MIYNVQFNKEKREVQCACRLFEFRGILCRHALSVFILEQVENVPENYILTQWRKYVRQRHTSIKVNYNDWSGNVKTQRFDRLQKKFYDLVDWAVESDENCAIFWDMMNELQLRKEKNNEKQERSNDHKSNPIGSPIDNYHKVSLDVIHSHLVVRRHGQPPKKCKISRAEKLVSTKKKVHDKNVKTKGKKVKVISAKECVGDDIEDGVSSFIPPNIDMQETITMKVE